MYQLNTDKSGVYVVPTNSTIMQIGNMLWAKTGNILDYAKKCQEYVAANYRYLNSLTGLHPLADILAAGGCDCGNLSSIYVSLLRYKGVPASHVVGRRLDGSAHVWAQFYIQDYGWIPVDVTYRNANPMAITSAYTMAGPLSISEKSGF